MKVFFDIIANHTADVISTPSTYITKETVPYRDADGVEFDDRDYARGDTFPVLDPAMSFPYEPTFPTPTDATVKVPAWLNDPTYYHNRGNAAFNGGESDIYGDFVGLDDLFTENSDVADKLIETYRYWAEFGIDGFRIDTVKHVNIEFWQKFGPAMREAAATVGKDKFFMFGEVYDVDPVDMSRFTTEGGLQATLDFGFQEQAKNFANGRGTNVLRDLFAGDDFYTDADSNVYSTPTFLGNHDMGRIGYFLKSGATAENPVDNAELLERDRLAHSLMYLTRGQPVVYYGDEQGFVGDGNDQNARQDMFASQVATYNDDDLIGTDATTAQDNYGTGNPVFQHIKAVSALRTTNPALADGAQIHRYSSENAGVYAFSRIDATEQIEYVVAANNSEAPATATFDTFTSDGTFGGLYPTGAAALTSDEEGRVTVTVPPLSVAVWKGAAPIPASSAAPAMTFRNAPGSTVGGRAEVGVAVPAGGFNQVSFVWRPAGSLAWTPLGTDDNAPYRVFHDVQDLATGTVLEYRAVLEDNAGHLAVAATSAVVGDPVAPPVVPGRPGGPVVQPGSVTVAGDAELRDGLRHRLAAELPDRAPRPPSGRRLVGDIHPPGRRLPVQGRHERRLGARELRRRWRSQRRQHLLAGDRGGERGDLLVRPRDALGHREPTDAHRHRGRELPVRAGLPGRRVAGLPTELVAGSRRQWCVHLCDGVHPGRQLRGQGDCRAQLRRELRRRWGGRRGGHPVHGAVRGGHPLQLRLGQSCSDRDE